MTKMTKHPRSAQRPRKPYSPPKIVRLGDVRHLTKSGTASGNEGRFGNGLKKP